MTDKEILEAYKQIDRSNSQEDSLFDSGYYSTYSDNTWQPSHGTPSPYPSYHTHTVGITGTTTGSINANKISHPQHVTSPTEGLDELCQILGVEPVPPGALATGLLLQGQSGNLYSLVSLIAAQVSIMTKLHVLLVHLPLAQETGE